MSVKTWASNFRRLSNSGGLLNSTRPAKTFERINIVWTTLLKIRLPAYFGKVCKGQRNSKLFFQADVSSKKRMIKFDFTNCRLVFVHFLEESEDTKKTFQI